MDCLPRCHVFACFSDCIASCLARIPLQTRGWFYTLMVLSTALFDMPAFKNLVCNGLVLASDGKKMSKRLQNYPVRLLVCLYLCVWVCSEYFVLGIDG